MTVSPPCKHIVITLPHIENQLSPSYAYSLLTNQTPHHVIHGYFGPIIACYVRVISLLHLWPIEVEHGSIEMKVIPNCVNELHYLSLSGRH